MSRFEHDALYYGSEDTFASVLGRFLREGLQEGHGAVAATTPEHVGILREELGPDAREVRFIEDEAWYTRPGSAIAGWKRLLEEDAAEGRSYSRIVGEVPFGRTPAEWTSWTRYESVLNAVFADIPAWIVCPYDLRTLPQVVLEDAHRTHPSVWMEGRRESDRYVDPARLLDEVPEPAPVVVGEPQMRIELSDRGLRDVRARVRGLAEGRLSPGRVEDLVLAVSEVAGNAIRHGDGRRRLALWVEGGRVVCEVCDEGGRFERSLAGFLPPDPNVPGGMGLWITRQLCDVVAIDASDGTTTVRVALEG